MTSFGFFNLYLTIVKLFKLKLMNIMRQVLPYNINNRQTAALSYATQLAIPPINLESGEQKIFILNPLYFALYTIGLFENWTIHHKNKILIRTSSS